MPDCTRCGGHVSECYHRVLSDRQGRVACIDCTPNRCADTLKNIGGYRVAPP